MFAQVGSHPHSEWLIKDFLGLLYFLESLVNAWILNQEWVHCLPLAERFTWPFLISIFEQVQKETKQSTSIQFEPIRLLDHLDRIKSLGIDLWVDILQYLLIVNWVTAWKMVLFSLEWCILRLLIKLYSLLLRGDGWRSRSSSFLLLQDGLGELRSWRVVWLPQLLFELSFGVIIYMHFLCRFLLARESSEGGDRFFSWLLYYFLSLEFQWSLYWFIRSSCVILF